MKFALLVLLILHFALGQYQHARDIARMREYQQALESAADALQSLDAACSWQKVSFPEVRR